MQNLWDLCVCVCVYLFSPARFSSCKFICGMRRMTLISVLDWWIILRSWSSGHSTMKYMCTVFFVYLCVYVSVVRSLSSVSVVCHWIVILQRMKRVKFPFKIEYVRTITADDRICVCVCRKRINKKICDHIFLIKINKPNLPSLVTVHSTVLNMVLPVPYALTNIIRSTKTIHKKTTIYLSNSLP